MSAPAAFQATVHSLRTVGSRKVVQIVIETPIEHLPTVVGVIGTIDPGSTNWVAVAKMNPNAKTSDPPLKERKRFHELPFPQQAAMLCADPVFQRFVYEEGYATGIDEEESARAVRGMCGVESRAQIIAGTAAALNWQDLRERYLAWKQVA